MMGSHVQTESEADAIRKRAELLACASHSSFGSDEATRKALNAHGIPDDEIDRQLSTLSSNTAESVAVLTSYSLLHSLQHLDEIEGRTPPLPLAGDAVVALLRCAEICLHNMSALSIRMTSNLEQGLVERAMSNARWRSGFDEVLYGISALVVEVNDGSEPGALLSIRDSRGYEAYRRTSDELRAGLMSRWAEKDADIFAKDLDDPLRFICFNEFANTSDERIWFSRLDGVTVPGADSGHDEDVAATYERIVCSSEMDAMLNALETRVDTDLLPFRAVHQIAEVIAGSVNRHLCRVVAELLDDEDFPAGGVRTLTVANRLLSVVDDAMKLLMRSLTPAAYEEVRPNLGMVEGTSSIVLRKTLFNQTYPLLVRAFKLRLCGLERALADLDDVVLERACALRASSDPERAGMSAAMQQLIILYQHIRTWRDNHQQFPKTHLGASPVPGKPTVSLAGSESGVHIAHKLRQKHATDPIAPLYEAVLGTPPPAVHELLEPGGFDEYMAHKTARAVFEVYADVQARFYDRAGARSGDAPS